MQSLRAPDEASLKAALKAAVAVLEAGGLLAYPTETFYALGVRFDSRTALRRLFKLKERPVDKAVPLIVGDAAALEGIVAGVDARERELMEAHWPGPLTLVLRAAPGLDAHIVQGGKVAVRVPGESFALLLARAAGFAITATSANPAGLIPPTETGMVREYFRGAIDKIIDRGATPGGPPSTIVEVKAGGLVILRQGAVRIVAGEVRDG